jgi:histidinol phosphatase-like PHP family hydrolase/predicted MPP superfamily phosphohydrolase
VSALDLLLLADLHYFGPETAASPLPERKGKFGLELAVRAVRDALRHDRPDVIVLLGDMVDLGSAPGAMDDLRALRDALAEFEIPVIAVPGNHDEFPDQVAAVFDSPPGLHLFGGYSVVTFADRYGEGDVCARPAWQMEALAAAARAARPIIVIQHPPLLPRIDAKYPYTITNAEGLAAEYARAGVVLSLSGHYHPGQGTFESEGVTYVTAPALCQRPFRYVRVRVEDGRVADVQTVPLAPPEHADLFDAHVHTEFAYCAEDVTIETALERRDLFGLRAMGLCEHSDHLYFPEEGYWRRTDLQDLAAARSSVAAGCTRYDRYRERVLPFRSERVFLGLEVEAAADGRGLVVLDEHRAGYDYLIGAVHSFQGQDSGLSSVEVNRRFMQRTEQLMRSGVDILAHPFRFFRRTKREVPTELYRPVAELLAAHGVAAEINFHTNQPDPAFFALCLEADARLSIGTDSHALVEVGDLRPHVELLQQIGAWARRDEVLWKPGRT